jgi:hypothetical protein
MRFRLSKPESGLTKSNLSTLRQVYPNRFAVGNAANPSNYESFVDGEEADCGRNLKGLRDNQIGISAF